MIGAAIATTLLNYLGAIPLILMINKRLNSNFFSYFPYKIYFTTLFLSIFICGILYFLFHDYLDKLYVVILLSVFFYILIIAILLKIF